MYFTPPCQPAKYVLTVLHGQIFPSGQPFGINFNTVIVHRKSHSTLSTSFGGISIFFIHLTCRSSLVSGSLWAHCLIIIIQARCLLWSHSLMARRALYLQQAAQKSHMPKLTMFHNAPMELVAEVHLFQFETFLPPWFFSITTGDYVCRSQRFCFLPKASLFPK
jgi:hypothetical protein